MPHHCAPYLQMHPQSAMVVLETQLCGTYVSAHTRFLVSQAEGDNHFMPSGPVCQGPVQIPTADGVVCFYQDSSMARGPNGKLQGLETCH